MEIVKEFHFDAAHWLPRVDPCDKDHRLHGHRYRVALHVTGRPEPSTGWVVSFAELKAAWRKVEAELDHRCLNDVEGLENPTVELITQWIWRRVRAVIPTLSVVTVHETDTAYCVYRGEDEDVEPDGR